MKEGQTFLLGGEQTLPTSRILLGLFAAAFIAGTAVADGLAVRSGPDLPFRVDGASAAEINSDILVRNDGEVALELVKIRMDALSRGGALLQRRELNGNGISPSILTVPDRKVEKNSSLLIYNPFPEFERSLPLSRLHFELTFKEVGSDRQRTVSLDVSPTRPPRSNYVLPVVGRYFVWDGYDFYSHHRRWNYLHPLLTKIGYSGNAGRYALDFIAVDASGNRSHGDETVNENWLSFGRTVRATADGVVIAVHGDSKDDHIYEWGGPNRDPSGVFGNYVVMRHADGTFSTFGHLMHNSLSVHVGDRVRAGQPIAQIGASGDAPFPHLHYQRTLSAGDLGEGAPVAWRRVRRVVGTKLQVLPFGYINSGYVVVGN